MPYCVNCGVQLGDNALECPLCQTEVIVRNNNKDNEKIQASKLEKELIENELDRSLWIKIISITLLIPFSITLIINWIFQNSLSWSLYVTASVLLVWIWTASLFLFRKNRFQKWLPIATFSLLGYLYIIENISRTNGWFFSIAVPIVSSLSILIGTLSYLIKNRVIRELQIPSSLFLGIGLLCFVANGSINFFNHQVVKLDWSLIVMVPCAAFLLIGFVFQRRPWVVEKIKHWFRF